MDEETQRLRATLDRINEILEVASVVERRQHRVQDDITAWKLRLDHIDTALDDVDRHQQSR